MTGISRETAIATAVSALAVGAMAVDHLIGTESGADADAFPVDPAAFAIGVAVSLGLVALLFAFVVRPAIGNPDRAARRAAVCSLLALPAVALLFLGVPFPLAGTGVALGLHGRHGTHRRLSTAAVAIGALVLALGVAAYVGALIV